MPLQSSNVLAIVLTLQSQPGSQTAELGVAKAVGAGGLGFGDEAAVGIVNAFGNRDEALAGLVIDAFDVGEELIHVKVDLGQIDQIGTVTVQIAQAGRGGEPAGVPAHALHDGDLADVIDAGVAADFHQGGRNVLRGGGKAGAVVRAIQVVVNGLGNADHAAFIVHLCAVAADFVAGVHGVVAAVVEEIADVVLLEDFENALVVGVVHIGILHLVTAGAERGRRGVEELLQFLGVLFVHYEEPIVQNALDAVACAVDLCDVLAVEGGADDAVCGCVDHGGGTAGLADDGRADQGSVRH